MNILKTSVLSLLMVAKAGIAMSQNDSIASNDSITWNKELDGIEVKAQRQLIKQEIDRIGYDVQADEESKTLTVIDMLRKVPMVTVDGEGNISVKGNSDFKIYKNGHYDPNLSKNAKEILKGMPASMVKRIEVITDPGAREDAEGVDAILNIVMKETSKMQGVTGSVSAAYNTLNRTDIDASITTQIDKLMVSADYGYFRQARRQMHWTQENTSTYKDTGNTMNKSSDQTQPGNVHYANINASYDIDSLNLLSASFGGYYCDLRQEGYIRTTLTAPSGETLQSYLGTFQTPDKTSYQSWNGRLDFEHKTRRKGERLTLSYMLALNRNNGELEHQYSEKYHAPFNYTGKMMTDSERFLEHTFQIDWLRPLGKGHQVEIGAKYINRNNQSDAVQTFYGTDNQLTDEFEHTTSVLAGYADYQYKKDRWSARAGLRYEYSYMKGSYPDGKGEPFHKHLSDWVPQASIRYQITDAQSLKLSYTTSISRPGISYLNPMAYTLPASVKTGNSHLSSAHSQRISLNYSYIGNKITLQLSPSYSFCSEGIATVQTAQGNVVYRTYDNILQRRIFSFSQYMQWQPFKGTTIIVNNTLYYMHYGNPEQALSNHGWCDYLYASLSQQLPWKLRLSLSGSTDIGREPSGVYAVDYPWNLCYASLQRSFLKDNRLTVSISIRNPYKKFIHTRTETIHGDFLQSSNLWQRTRSIGLSVSYRFGSLKASVKKAATSITNDDMVGGISKG
jgi:hypothetical protein